MKKDLFLKILLGTLIISAIVTIIQIWVPILEWKTYLKLLGTMGIVFLLVGLIIAITSDFKNTKDLKDKNYLD